MWSVYPKTPFPDLTAAVREHILADHPKVTLFNRDSKVRAQGSCFAENIAAALKARGIDVSLLPMVEIVNSPIANKIFFEHLLDPSKPYEEQKHEKVMSRELLDGMRAAIPNEDVFIFTLGVAPIFYRRTNDSPVFYPSAKEIEAFEMRHTSVEDNEEAIWFIVNAMRTLNPRIKIVLTVSPVPLSRCQDLGSAVEADCISKSTLRIAVANVMAARISGLFYWPSFEIVRWLAPHIRPAYGQDDQNLRHVNKDIVRAIADLFIEHYGA